MVDRRRIVAWFMAGVIAALFLQLTQVQALGGRWDALLHVGEAAPGRDYIEDQLPDVTLMPELGHDGQTVFIVASDPFMADQHAQDGLDSAGFRYRRILYPLLAGLGGLLPPGGTLAALSALSAAAVGLAAASVARLTSATGWRRWLPAMVLVAPGLWLSVRLLTVDVPAMALMLAGLVAVREARVRLAAVLFVGAALTKDVYLVSALAAAVTLWVRHDRHGATLVAIAPTAALTAWSVVVELSVGEGLTPRGNFGAPLRGLVDSVATWIDRGDAALGVLVVASVVASGVVAATTAHRWVAAQLAPWIGIAVVMSTWVWIIPGNAARALLPLWALAVVAVGLHPVGQPSTSRRNLPVYD